VLHKEVHKLSI